MFEHGAYADRALRSAAQRAGLEGRERALAQRLAYGAVQRRRTCDYVVERFASRPTARIDPPLLAAVRLGAYELLFEEGAEHAAVDQAVGLAKGGRAGGRRSRGAGLVNAVLRRVAGEGEALLAALGEEDPAAAAVHHSLPDWIAELWWSERGPDQARLLMAAANNPTPRVFRVTPSGRQDRIAESLADGGVALSERPPVLGGTDLIEVSGGEWSLVETAVERGHLVPQSFGSALAASLLGVEPGNRVLDLCAAPGIKATQLAALADDAGGVVAVERDAGRAGELRALCERVGAGNVEVIIGDGRQVEVGAGYDRVLVDAPCSGLGTLASRPDLRWRRTAAEIGPTAVVQRELLEAGTRALRPGGSLVYSVCTISRRESEEVVSSALAGDDGLRAADLGSRWPALADDRDDRFLQTLCDRDHTDGFFIARIERGDG